MAATARPFRPARLGQQGYNGTTTVFGALAELSGDPLATADAERLSRVRRAGFRHLAIARRDPRGTASYDALRVLRLGEDYALSDLWLGADRSAVNLLSVRVSEGTEAAGAIDQRQLATSPRLGEQTGFIKIDFEASRTQTLFTPWEGASVGLMGLLHRPVVGQHPAAGGTVLSRRRALHPRLLCGAGGGRQGAGGNGRTAAQHRLRNDSRSKVLRHLHPVLHVLRLGRDLAESSIDRDAMINSAGGGVRAQVTRYVEVDFEGSPGSTGIPNGGSIPATASRR